MKIPALPLVCGLLLFPLLSQQTLAQLSPTQQTPAKSRVHFALIIGANRSVDLELKPLKYADDDAARYFELFRTLGMQTLLLTQPDENTRRLHPQAAAEAHDPNATQLEDAVNKLAHQVARAKGSQFSTVFYFVFAGHGNFKDKGYLTLQDQRITGQELFENIVDRVDADETHLIIDACYSYFLAYGRGPGGTRKPVSGFSAVDIQTERNVGFLLSTSAANESHEWEAFQAGIFSHEIRSGLYGAADADGDGFVSYKEIAAFVSHANSSIPNEKFRPKLYAKPPPRSSQLVDLRVGLTRGLEIGPTQVGHNLLEDSRGVRILDFNKGAKTVSLVRPVGTSTLYLRNIDSDKEYVIPPSDKPITVAMLTPEDRRSQGRGAAHHAFSKIFKLPFDEYVVAAYRFPQIEPPEITPAKAPNKQPQKLSVVQVEPKSHWTPWVGWPLVGASAVSAVAGGALIYLAAQQMDVPEDKSQKFANAVQSEINTKVNSAVVLFGVAGGAAIAGATFLAWPLFSEDEESTE